MTEQTTSKIVNIHDRPPTTFEHVEVFLGIVVALITIGGFIWKMRGKPNDDSGRN